MKKKAFNSERVLSCVEENYPEFELPIDPFPSMISNALNIPKSTAPPTKKETDDQILVKIIT